MRVSTKRSDEQRLKQWQAQKGGEQRADVGADGVTDQSDGDAADHDLAVA